MNYPRSTTAMLLGVFLLAACGGADSDVSTTDSALEELQRKYDELTAGKLDDPMQWASDDLKRIGDWDYRVVEIGNLEATEFEAALNDFGAERWELVWMDKTLAGHTIVLKRPSVSYLSKIPLSQIGRLVIGGPEGEQ